MEGVKSIKNPGDGEANFRRNSILKIEEEKAKLYYVLA